MSTRYRAKPRHITAYCWSSGLIGFTTAEFPFCPKGTLPIISGPFKLVRRTIHATSRIAYDNKGFLVPGIPEASLLKIDPVEALLKHTDWLLKRPGLYKAIAKTSTEEAA